MSLITLQRWTGEPGESQVLSLTNDGTNLYAGLNTNPAKAMKIDPSDMSTLDSWTVADGRYVHALAYDGTYLYAAIDWPF